MRAPGTLRVAKAAPVLTVDPVLAVDGAAEPAALALALVGALEGVVAVVASADDDGRGFVEIGTLVLVFPVGVALSPTVNDSVVLTAPMEKILLVEYTVLTSKMSII
jgi:hypothetical protein